MPPKEIQGRLNAFYSAKKEAYERDDRMAWLIGVYGHISPKNYPKSPTITHREREATTEGEDMSVEDMKNIMRALMRKGGKHGNTN